MKIKELACFPGVGCRERRSRTSQNPGWCPGSQPKDCVRDGLPPWRVDAPGVYGKGLQQDHGDECIDVNAVDASFYIPVANHAEDDQRIDKWVEEVVVEPE